MGDGGVACAPSQHVMEILAISDGFCGGGNGGFGSKENQLAAGSLRERKMGVDGGEGDAAPRRSLKSEVEKVDVASSCRSRQRQVEKGEVVLPEEQSPSDEIEKGEILPENGEVFAGRWRKGELENGEFVPENWRQEEDAKGRNLHRVSMNELENGEFVPDRWRRISEVERTKDLRGEEAKDGFLSEKVQSWELEKGDMAPESCGANDYASSRRNQSSSSSKRGAREFSASRRKRSSSRWDPSIEKELSKSGSSKGDEKLEPAKSDSNRKYHGEYNHPSGSKCRRLSVDGHSSSHSEKPHSRLSVERPYKHSSSSAKVPSSSRCESPRHHDSSSSKGTHDKHGKSPAYSERERSPHDRARKAEHRDRSSRSHHDRGSPGHSLRSPLDRFGRHHRHGRSPVHLERSPLDRNRDYRERTPKRTPADSGRDLGRLKSNGKTKGSSEGLEKQHNRSDEKTGVRDSNGSGKDSHKSSTSRHTRKNNDSSEKCNENQSLGDKDAQNDVSVCADDPPIKVAEYHEEPPSMEEDMDICNTPPHTPVTVDLNMGKWFYLDYNGLEQGPSKLGDLKQLVEEGIIQSDHLVKHSESDRWVTVENAASPIISVNYSSIVSDSVTQLVTPPEAPGNLLLDSGNFENHLSQYDDNSTVPELMEDLHFDERIEALMEGRVLVPGQELVTLGEALNLTFEHVEWEKCGTSEDFMSSRSCFRESLLRQREQDYGGGALVIPKENSETRFYVNSEKDFSLPNNGFCEWFTTGHWTCKGGDWKRNDEVALDKAFRKKVILNEGYPLCQTSKTGHEDPRRHRKEDLYVSLRGRKLDLPLWAFSSSEESNDSNVAVKSCQMKPLATRVKGTMQPVVKINACVVRDRGSAVGDSRHKSRSNDRQASLKPVKSFSSNTDAKGSSTEGVSQSKRILGEEITPCGNKSRTFINIPKDKVRKMNELELSLGDWFYLDGTGHEHGPKSFSELQVLAAKGTIEMSSSVFRKVDNLWVPISNVVATSRSARSREGKLCSVGTSSTSSFNNMHPQFVGYMRGKLHELVMKSFRSREFAAAINEVLDPWIAAKQPKKEIDRQFAFNNSLPKDEGYARFGKRARFMSDGFEETDDLEEDPSLSHKDHTFEDLFPEIPHNQDSDNGSDGWGLLNCRILARVFHFLRNDFKSLAFSAGTCRFWNSAVKAYRSVSKHVDFSFIGPACTDAIFNTILRGYDKSKVKSISLRGCSNINVTAVEDILKSFPSIESIDIRESGGHLGELSASYKEVNWIGGRRPVDTNPEDSYSKIRSLKQVTERSYIISRANWEYGSHVYDPANKINPLSDRKNLAVNSIQQTPYNRRKLFGARKASAVLSRDAHLRRWLNQKSENRYKKMEEYLASYLKDIMKKNTCDFFVPKVAEIEDKMKNGCYSGHGLSSIKEDISKMCRAAFRTKNHGDKGEMNRMIMLFIKLIRSLDNPPRISSSRPRDEVEGVSGSTASTYKKKLGKATSEKKGLRSNGSIYGDCSTENGKRASDREIKRRLNKLNRRTLDSESETSDDLDPSEEDSNGADGDGTNSDTESDIDFHSVGVNEDAGEGFSFVVDGPMDSMADEREWGARMTKASLVPPVTRKYEVIDKYVITADAEEVQRKMKVSLPDDYAARLKAQKDSDEPDPDFVEVKEYKPRKKLGDEVLEQEVYGIDPYTHNLLLDSVPEEMPDWTFSEKHMFIEELVLRVLNKQVRHFTDTGSTPMTYPLRPVLEEIQRTAEDDGNKRVTKLCQIILKAIRSRPEDHYVAYRKGLGVVCDKEGGFKEDDFVVEFLGEVYPAWRWFEKQDGIRSLQKNKEDPAPEFYNIYLERPKGDKDGYDLVVVDAMHKANYASRICHSCRPNCEAKVTAVNGQYQIGIYAIRPIAFGEEITFDYNSVTESKEEYEASVCLCGSQVCRGSYLNLTGDGAFQKVMKECHGILDRHQLMLEACELNYVTEDDYLDLARASLGSCLLSGLPDWVIAYSARMVRFINFERTKLPDEILAYNLEEKRKLYLDVSLEVEKNEAEIQAEGVYNQRLQNLAITLDKVRYVLRSVYGDARKAPPPLEKLSAESLVSALWKGSGSLVDELLQCMAPHMEEEIMDELKLKIDAHDPSGSSDVQKELQKSLLWLRDEVRNLPCSPKCRHDAAADLIHVYAYTKCFFRVRGQGQVTSEPVYISPLDLGPKYADKMSSDGQEYLKTYSENYCLGQLIYWHNQTNPDPDCRLTRVRQGCLLLPDITSFYYKSQKPSPQRVYGHRTVKFMLSRMEKQPQRSWPKNKIWQFKSDPKIFGSPMLDAVISKSNLDKEMVHWLRSRTSMYQAAWDQ